MDTTKLVKPAPRGVWDHIMWATAHEYGAEWADLLPPNYQQYVNRDALPGEPILVWSRNHTAKLTNDGQVVSCHLKFRIVTCQCGSCSKVYLQRWRVAK